MSYKQICQSHFPVILKHVYYLSCIDTSNADIGLIANNKFDSQQEPALFLHAAFDHQKIHGDSGLHAHCLSNALKHFHYYICSFLFELTSLFISIASPTISPTVILDLMMHMDPETQFAFSVQGLHIHFVMSTPL